MTQTQYKALREKHSHLSNGQFLTFITYRVLENIELTIMQMTAKENVNSMGTFNPSDDKVYVNIIEILTLASNDKADSLIQLLKRLPPLDIGATNVKYYINEIEAPMTHYYDADKFAGVHRDTSITNSEPSMLMKVIANNDLKYWLEFKSKLGTKLLSYPYYNPSFIEPEVVDYSHLPMSELLANEPDDGIDFSNPTRTVGISFNMFVSDFNIPKPLSKVKAFLLLVVEVYFSRLISSKSNQNPVLLMLSISACINSACASSISRSLFAISLMLESSAFS